MTGHAEARRHLKDRRVARMLSFQWMKNLQDIRTACAKYRSAVRDYIRAGDHLGAAGNLGDLGAYGLHPRGIYRLLRRTPGGWADIERAAVYQALAIAATRAPTSIAGAILAHMTVIGQRKLAEGVSNSIGRDMRQNPDDWDKRYFARFVMHLRGRASGEGARPDGMTTGLDLGPFQRVLATWTDAAALGSALSDVCEYHMGETSFAKNFGEFEVFYMVTLVEIAFIRAM